MHVFKVNPARLFHLTNGGKLDKVSLSISQNEALYLCALRDFYAQYLDFDTDELMLMAVSFSQFVRILREVDNKTTRLKLNVLEASLIGILLVGHDERSDLANVFRNSLIGKIHQSLTNLAQYNEERGTPKGIKNAQDEFACENSESAIIISSS